MMQLYILKHFDKYALGICLIENIVDLQGIKLFHSIFIHKCEIYDLLPIVHMLSVAFY